MACLQLRGTGLGEIDAVLFDKDGTLSISEPELLTLAAARVFLKSQADNNTKKTKRNVEK